MIDTYVIQEPIWKGKRVGIAEFRVEHSDLHILINYRTTDGSLLFPYVYLFRKENRFKYPRMFVRGVNLIMVPIADLEKVSKREVKP